MMVSFLLFVAAMAIGIGAFVWIQKTKHLQDLPKVDE